MTDQQEIARAGLSKAQHLDWIKTVLVLAGRERLRSSFVAGYNDQPRLKPSSEEMREAYDLGVCVRRHLTEEQGNG